MGGPSTPGNCEDRCRLCEVWSHKVHPSGNPSEEQRAAFRSNPNASFALCNPKRTRGAKKNRRKLAKRQRRLLRRAVPFETRELLRLYGPDPERLGGPRWNDIASSRYGYWS
jgi:hypothetical protein